jgi:site-specific DNA recombinase
VALNEPGTAAEAGEIIRSLIDHIVLTPADGLVKAELFGELATLVRFSEERERGTKSAGSAGEPALLSVVAGIGFEPMTFRL